MARGLKVETQLLVSPRTNDRAMLLAAVRGEPRSEIFRVALENGGLPELEKMHEEELVALCKVAKRLHLLPAELAKQMTDARPRLTLAQVREWTPTTA